VDRCSVVQPGPSGRRERHRRSLVRLWECLIREENERCAGGGNFDVADIVSLVANNGLNINNAGGLSVRARYVAERLASPRDIILLCDGQC